MYNAIISGYKPAFRLAIGSAVAKLLLRKLSLRSPKNVQNCIVSNRV